MSCYQDILGQIDKNGIETVHFIFIDPTGILRCKSVLSKEIKETINISLLDGVSINGNLIPGYQDKNKWFRAVPDLNSFFVLPKNERLNTREAAFMCSISNTTFDSRRVIHEMTTHASHMSLFPMCGMAFSYGMLDNSAKRENGAYCMLPGSMLSNFNTLLVRELISCGIDIESFMSYGSTHNGIELVPQSVAKSIDQIMICRWIACSLGIQNSYQISISLPFANACPIHISIWNDLHSRNLFYSSKGKLEYSDLAWHFIAGILANFDEIFAVIQATAPNITLAHLRKTFSATDTDCVLGTPEFFIEKDKKERIGWSKRCVFRGIPIEANLYLVLGCIFMAGLFGIKNRLLPEEYSNSDYDNYSISTNDKRKKLMGSKLFNNYLGNDVISALNVWLEEQE